MDDRFNSHDVKMEPIYNAYQSANTAGRFIVWAGKIFMAVGVVLGGIIAAFTFFR